MKYFILLLSLCVLFVSGCVTSTPDSSTKVAPVPPPKIDKTEKVKDGEQKTFLPAVGKNEILPLSKAYSVYKSSKHKPNGVHIHSGIVFVIVNIDTPAARDRRGVKGKAMLQSQAMLRKYFSLPQKFSFEYLRQEAYNREGTI